jgi:hypothetical protein
MKDQQTMNETDDQQAETYEPPTLTEIGPFAGVTTGQYSRTHSADSDAGGYWNE